MKFCKDCKHCQPTRFQKTVGFLWFAKKIPTEESVRYADCSRRPDAVDMVSGAMNRNWRSCWEERFDKDLCGSQAKFFEPKEDA